MNEQEKCRWFDSNLNAYLDGELDRETRDRYERSREGLHSSAARSWRR
jgi:anti-sigma factor RsiW